MRHFRSACAIIALVLIASCAPRSEPPAPAPATPPPPAPVLPAPPPLAWQDAPLSAGDWTYRAEGAGSVAAYGAAAKGNTLLNLAGVRSDLVEFVVDQNPAKKGKYLPGSRIPIVSETRLKETKPDFVILLPWNLKAELARQLDYVGAWGGSLVTAVPRMEVL